MPFGAEVTGMMVMVGGGTVTDGTDGVDIPGDTAGMDTVIPELGDMAGMDTVIPVGDTAGMDTVIPVGVGMAAGVIIRRLAYPWFPRQQRPLKQSKRATRLNSRKA